MTKKIVSPKILKGFRDFFPEDSIKRQYLVEKIRDVFELYGFSPVETPALEYLETFKGQIGEDENMFFKFKDKGGRSIALRYDQTVPICRFIAQNKNKINLPFKRYQIQLAWRAEKPQKGRYREFLQCDADIFGVSESQADAEVIALSMEIYKRLGFKNIVTLINDRSLFKNIPYPVIVSIDKLKKIGKVNVISEIIKKGFSKKQAEEYLKKVINLKPNNTIKSIFAYLKVSGFPKSWYKFEPTLARSFSYSTGPIWEIEILGFTSGSVLGGERFDKLIGTFSKNDIAATGFGLGFDRTLEALEMFNLIPSKKTNTKVLVTIFAPKYFENSITIANELRNLGINTELYIDKSKKLDKQFKYADRRNIPYVLIIGPEEIKKNIVKIKDMKTGKQKENKLKEIVKNIINEN